MSTPAVSVLLPTHDRPAFLAEALASVLTNGFDDFEIIISDDSATGSARAVVEAANDPRLHYYAKPGGTKAENWQHAAAQARGTYCVKLDDDDLLLPGFLSRCAAWLDAHPEAASVYTGYEVEAMQTAARTPVVDRHFFGPDGGVVSGDAYLLGVLANVGGYPMNHKTAGFFRREAAERIGFFRWANEDFVFSAALGLRGAVGYLPEVLYRWRVHTQNGVQDLWKTYALSAAACKDAQRVPPEARPAGWREEWDRLLDRTAAALPLYYLKAGFVEHNRATAWDFWKRLRAQNGAAAWHPALVISLVAGLLLPRAAVRAAFEFYKRCAPLQRAVRAMLR